MRTLRLVGESESDSMSIEPRLQIHRCDDDSPLDFAAAEAADAEQSE